MRRRESRSEPTDSATGAAGTPNNDSNDPAGLAFGSTVPPAYAVLGPSDDLLCEHIVAAPTPDGDWLPCYRLPEPCDRCWDRFATMVRTEVKYVLERCGTEPAWVCRMPADDDPFRGRWHLPVGSRVRAHGTDAGAFVVEMPNETFLASTHGLWGGPGRMLRERWLEVPIEAVRIELAASLDARLVGRAEMFYRARFFEHLFPLGPNEWGVPLSDTELEGMFARVAS